MAIFIEFSPEARAMLDEADERWIAEHGFDADNLFSAKWPTRLNC